MGTSWRLVVVDPPEDVRDCVEAVLARMIGEFSHYEPSSRVGRFNRMRLGQWQPLSPEAMRVLDAAFAVCERSDGAFDPATGVLVDLWGFGPAGPRQDLPSAYALGEARSMSGVRHLEYDREERRIRRREAAQIDLSGIAKGYAVDAIAERLVSQGIEDFLIEIGGELRGEGIKPDGQPWWVELEAVPGARLAPLRIALHGLSVATSGDYRRFFDHGGRRYAHSIDPRTGCPVANQVVSVSVLHREAMLADAWATALTVLGPAGMSVAEREGLAAHLVTREAGGFAEQLSPALQAMLG
ncbi:FAD:protein FMN transferase [Sphingomonas sp. HT-1]|uniref:FAD:protein FMN transferase n=1 Tax=unclassified Sphingomonas TaxID=196159 RepID=UPI00031F68EC|nr:MULTISPECIES: FAD:protein FMN transferase [unclassified Sphingomonas]KTF69554.1 thiamine biosynthesis protein ApbE [Sphingomonas sp. WG]